MRQLRLGWLLIAFLGFGLIRLTWGIDQISLLAMRDFAPWYYALVALGVGVELTSEPQSWRYLVNCYRRAIPWFLVWAPLAVFLERTVQSAPTIPGSETLIVSFKAGDMAVLAAMATAFVWLDDSGSPLRRRVLGLLGVFAVSVAGTQSRGGFLAAAAIWVVVLMARPARRREFATVLGFSAAMIVLLGLLGAPSTGTVAGREFSAGQLTDNVVSIVAGSDDWVLQNSVVWRQTLWIDTVAGLERDDAILFGNGFGRNLFLFRAADAPDDPFASSLRNPHNSHLNILARTGVIGLLLWLGWWSAWALKVGKVVRQRRLPPRAHALTVLAAAGGVGWLINAFFDPALEGPQGAIWLWTLAGIGLAGLALRPSISARLPQRRTAREKT